MIAANDKGKNAKRLLPSGTPIFRIVLYISVRRAMGRHTPEGNVSERDSAKRRDFIGRDCDSPLND